MTDSDGNTWAEAGVNNCSQKLLRCIHGPRAGEITLDTRCAALRPEPKPAAPGGYDPENAWRDSWNSY